MASARLRFRRHLAACVLVLLVAELKPDGQIGAGRTKRAPRVKMAAAASHQSGQLGAAGRQWAPAAYPPDVGQAGPASIMDTLAHLLPVLDFNYTLPLAGRPNGSHHLDERIGAYYAERFAANMSVDELQLMAVKAALRVAPVQLHTSWGYETAEQLRQGSLPVRDDLLCYHQLAHLVQRLDWALEWPPADPTQAAPVGQPEPAPAYRSLDLDMMRYLDTFGRAPSDLLRGNIKWHGSYASCLDTRLEPLDDEERHATPGPRPPSRPIKFRYCLGALRSLGWRQDDDDDDEPRLRTVEAQPSQWLDFVAQGTKHANLNNYYFYRLGLCLPEACDSSALHRPDEARSIERLAKFSLVSPFNTDHYRLADLYCLPDNRSPVRQIPLLGKLLLAAAIGWLALIGGATVVHVNEERFFAKTAEQIGREQALGGKQDKCGGLVQVRRNWIRLNVHLRAKSRSLACGVDPVECMSLYSNWLRYTAGARRADVRQRARPANEQLVAAPMGARVDTAPLNALKALAFIWIMAGHCILYLGSAVANGALLKNYTYGLGSFALTSGAIYITELFFIVTGCLTAYLNFKHNTKLVAGGTAAPAPGATGERDKLADGAKLARGHAEPEVHKLVSAPDGHDGTSGPALPGEPAHRLMDGRLLGVAFWCNLVVSRYLRILPTYLLVYAFVKLVSVRVGGQGPTWDYGVSANSLRRSCATESWLPVVSLTTNFVNVYEHCIVGGWYLSVDMQFMLMAAPLLLVVAHCQLAGGRSGGAQLWRKRAAGPAGPGDSGARADIEITSAPCPARGQAGADKASRPAPALGWRLVAPATSRLVAAHALLASLGLVSAAGSMLYYALYSQVDLSFILKFAPHTIAMLSTNLPMYTNPLFRFRAFVPGLILGHLLYLYEFNLVKLPKFIQQHGAKLTTIIFMLAFCIMFMPVLYPRGKIIISHDMTAIFTILSAAWIDISLAMIILLICIGKAPKFVLFVLSSPSWSLLSSLSLSAFLIHAEIIVILTSNLEPAPSISLYPLLFVFCTTLVLTYTLALGLYLVFELPISRLIESTMRKCSATSGRRFTRANRERRHGEQETKLEAVGVKLKLVNG